MVANLRQRKEPDPVWCVPALSADNRDAAEPGSGGSVERGARAFVFSSPVNFPGRTAWIARRFDA